MDTNILSWYDYSAFILMVLFSISIGLYFGCFKNDQPNRNKYLLGGQNMKPLPVALSLIASYCSTGILLGISEEVYRYGAYLWLITVSLIIVGVVTIYVFLPVFFNLKLTTTYEYLERRFDYRTRKVASAIFAFSLVLYLAFSLYVPALTLSAATGISIHVIIVGVSMVCIFYTSIGGLKAVVWTDSLQFLVVATTFIAILVAAVKSQEIWTVWQKASDGGRLDVFRFDPDPTRSDSFWAVIIGYTFSLMALVSVDQTCVQKYLAVSTSGEASLCVIYYIFGQALVTAMCILIGLLAYGKYGNCDLYSTNIIKRSDELLPYYVTDMAREIPGLSGFYFAAVFGSSLSLQSTLLNCLAATIYSDFISKFFNITSERKAGNILKTIVVIVGIIGTALIFVVENFGNIFSFIISLTGVTCGPTLGLFTLGFLCPKANHHGAFYGSICGTILLLFISIPTGYYKSQGLLVRTEKPLSTDDCSFANETNLNFTTVNFPSTFQPHFIFRISFHYYAFIGVAVTVICGLVISYLTNRKGVRVEKELFSPVVHSFLPEECVGKTESDVTAELNEEEKCLNSTL